MKLTKKKKKSKKKLGWLCGLASPGSMPWLFFFFQGVDNVLSVYLEFGHHNSGKFL
jgi:hypothetical protein